jgi:hypothetical protein
MKDHIGYTIVSHNEEDNSLLIRPHSPLFKNEPDTYPVYNINISNLNQGNELEKEIAKVMIPIIDNILESEKELPLNMKNQLKKMVNKKVNLSKENLEKENNPFQLIKMTTLEHQESINRKPQLDKLDIEFL